MGICVMSHCRGMLDVIAVEAIEPFDLIGSWREVVDSACTFPPANVDSEPGYLHLLQNFCSLTAKMDFSPLPKLEAYF